VTRVLLDSGVWVAALRTDDPDHPSSARLLRRIAAQRLSASALDLTLYEVVNVAVRRSGSPAEAGRLLTLITEACEDALVRADPDLLDRAAVLAARHDLSGYDAAYVAASRALGWPLVSTDRRDLVDPGFAVGPEAYAA
jgi:predicted nucleic acid-binding protein